MGRTERRMTDVRTEFDSLGAVEVSADKLWGPQTQRSLQHFSIGQVKAVISGRADEVVDLAKTNL